MRTDPIGLVALHGRELLDQAAMQHSLVAIEIFSALCDGPSIRNAVAGESATLAAIDSAAAGMRAVADELYREADCGSTAALDAYRRLDAAIAIVGGIMSRKRLFGECAALPGTDRAFRRFDHDAVAVVEAASGMFSLRTYFEALHAVEPAIATLPR